jgi:hypothetical protein
MTIPQIFRWPTPWLWGGILGIVALNAEHPGEFLSGLATVIIVASAIYYFHGRCADGDSEQETVEGGLDERLEQIERRLTDTQDVMIALSEKVDRLEEDGRPVQASSTTQGSSLS